MIIYCFYYGFSLWYFAAQQAKCMLKSTVVHLSSSTELSLLRYSIEGCRVVIKNWDGIQDSFTWLGHKPRIVSCVLELKCVFGIA